MAQPSLQQCVPATVVRKLKEMGKANSKAATHHWILSTIALCVSIVHVTAFATECNWSAWKRLCKAERAAMTMTLTSKSA